MIARIGCVQMNAAPDIDANLDAAERGIRRAAAEGAVFIATPENTSGMFANQAALRESARPESEHPAVPRFAALAQETGTWLLAGSITVTRDDDSRLANRSLLFAPTGEIEARYDKIHMFDADPADGQAYRESATFHPGEEAVVARTSFGTLGFTICYDVRFPALYAALARAGATVITIPAAFTVPTGRAHWHVLLRARAIETGAFIVAPAQTGEHAGGRKTFGHSLIVAPWGEILADGGEGEGVVVADCDSARVVEARRMIRALDHARAFSAPAVI